MLIGYVEGHFLADMSDSHTSSQYLRGGAKFPIIIFNQHRRADSRSANERLNAGPMNSSPPCNDEDHEDMIHLRIPDSTLSSDHQGNFRKFNFFINGSYHCSVRFSKLLRLQELLARERGINDVLPAFPPKKLFDLNAKQLEERRDQLEKYFSAAIRIDEPEISSLLTKFFLESQQESVDVHDVAPCGSTLLVYLFTLDGTKVELTVDLSDNTSAVVKKFAQKIGLRHSSVPHFGIFLVKRGPGKLYSLVRWLQDFESPIISQFLVEKSTGESHKLVVRKTLWDLSIESHLLSDQNAANLLFTQAVSDVDLGLLPLTGKVLKSLESFRKKSHIIEYVRLCQVQNFYGFFHFDPCKSDFPRKDSLVNISLGNMLMVFKYDGTNKPDDKEAEPTEKLTTTFKVTRIRTWKLVRTHDKETNNLYLTFEYMVTRDQMEWISIYTRQAALLSLCLKSMVSEAARQYIPDHLQISPDLSSPSTSRGCDSPSQLETPASSSGSLSVVRLNQRGNRRISSSETPVYESFHEINVKTSDLPRGALMKDTTAAITDADL